MNRAIDATGIWNTPYEILDGDSDNYPLMEPFENYLKIEEDGFEKRPLETWHSVITFSGTGGEKTPAFVIKGNEWRVKRTVIVSATWSIFYIQVVPEGKASKTVAEWGGRVGYSHTATQYIRKGNGRYYFNVLAMNIDGWELVVEDYY
jgi:hypothetical protein